MSLKCNYNRDGQGYNRDRGQGGYDEAIDRAVRADCKGTGESVGGIDLNNKRTGGKNLFLAPCCTRRCCVLGFVPL